MKFHCGEYADVNGYLGPIRMIGLYTDLFHDGITFYALCFWKLYIVVTL